MVERSDTTGSPPPLPTIPEGWQQTTIQISRNIIGPRTSQQVFSWLRSRGKREALYRHPSNAGSQMNADTRSRQNGLCLAHPSATRPITIAEGFHADRLVLSVQPAERVIGMTGKSTDPMCGITSHGRPVSLKTLTGGTLLSLGLLCLGPVFQGCSPHTSTGIPSNSPVGNVQALRAGGTVFFDDGKDAVKVADPSWVETNTVFQMAATEAGREPIPEHTYETVTSRGLRVQLSVSVVVPDAGRRPRLRWVAETSRLLITQPIWDEWQQIIGSLRRQFKMAASAAELRHE